MTPTGPSLLRRDVVVVLCAAAGIVALGLGMRQSFGLFMPAVTGAIGGGREMFGFAIALQNLLWGLAQPGVGMLADRFGSRVVAMCGGLVYALGLLAAALASTALALNMGLGLFVGVGLSGTAFVVVFGAVARVVPAGRQGLALSLVTAAGSFGMFLLVPVGQGLLAGLGWQGAFVAMAGLAAGMSVLALCFPRDATPAATAAEGTLRQALGSASRHRGYWLLTTGFFVCGFHVAFIATHLPAYLTDGGIAGPVAATTLALIGLFNILGSVTFGMLGDRFAKPRVLSSLYAARVAVILVFLLVPLSPLSAVVFGAAIGFLWLGTVPLTSGVVGRIFGPRYLGSLFGIVFFSHQLGSFAGAWLGGYLYDLTGGYDTVWSVTVLLGLLATFLHLPISDRPLARVEGAAQQQA